MVSKPFVAYVIDDINYLLSFFFQLIVCLTKGISLFLHVHAIFWEIYFHPVISILIVFPSSRSSQMFLPLVKHFYTLAPGLVSLIS